MTAPTRTLPLTVLVWEGPQARAYLVRMRRAGLRPQRIVIMVGGVASKLPEAIATSRGALTALAKQQDRRHNFHAYSIRKEHPKLVAACGVALRGAVDDAAGMYTEMLDGFRYDRYADHVEWIAASKYGDASVAAALRRAAGPVLFTGGGLVPRSVFDIPGVQIIHAHTGLLPHVRGADVLLWSLLVRGRPAVSAFLMTPGLDDGDVLAAREFEPMAVDLTGADRPDDDTLYRALFCFVDPLLRAEVLVRDVLEPWDGDALLGVPQDMEQGVTFHFMHPTVRMRGLDRLYPAPPLAASGHETIPARQSIARYSKYYEGVSVVAPLRFMADSVRSGSSLRTRSLRNRMADYSKLISQPARMPLHARIQDCLVRQERDWPSYDYGEGYHYQSSAELGITGLRDTAGRVEAFRLAEHVAGRSVLEIGCNAGFLSLAIAPAASRVVAFEVNPFLIEIAEIGRAHLGITNTEFLTTAFEDFPTDSTFDVVLSFANHHTYDGNTRQSIEEYFARCHAATSPDGVLLFESHPPAIERSGFAHTLALLERYYTIETSEVHEYGTFLDRDRRFIVARRRDL